MVLSLCACGSKKDGGGAAAGSGSAVPTVGSGSGSAEVSAAGSGSAGSGSAGSGSAAPGCTLDGNYRLRFHSNGAEGWWLRLAVAGKDVKPTGAISMLGLGEAGPLDVQLDDTACTLTLTKKTKQAGDLKVALKVDAAKVSGTVHRTSRHDKPETPIAGVRETTPEKPPACIKPGRYEIDITNVKKWTTEDDRTCDEHAGIRRANVRIEMLDGTLLIDEADTAEPFDQGFARATVKRTGECEADIAIAVQDFKLATAHIKFEGDKITGTTTDFTFEVFEDGEEGENQWFCKTTQGDVVFKRLGD